ncbi:hypothetical protein Ocin01_13120 [Orchesella cincta]|uniref:Uncharacterized protein n=1 Tax=Orchesella cincta TaxID=48709 RepID=A0A1D2MKT0_ORCCI|nr:hypothetical protein Ocin01_13120 [Orchesella cincta]
MEAFWVMTTAILGSHKRLKLWNDGVSTASNASERGVDGNGTLASSSSLPKQKTKHEMEKEMTKKLNSAGRDMHELQALLLQESILTGNLLDPCLEPLVSRYSDQIKVADAILNSAAAASSSSTLNKEKYHYYLEELQDFDWGKSQYDDFMNSTTMEKDHIASEDEWNDENENHVQIVSEALFNADSLNTEDDKVTFLRWNGISQDSDGSGDLKRIEFREATGSNSLNSVLELERDSCCRVNSTRCIASNASTTKSSCQKSSSSRLKTVKAYVNERQNQSPQLTESPSSLLSTELTNSVACSDENIISDITEDVTDFHRYKVLRRKQKSNSLRPRMQDVFHKTKRKSGDIPWANKSKGANESWYEFKERCSATSLQQRLHSSETSNRHEEDLHSPFKLQDYIPEKTTSPHRKSTKSVRFSPSPNGHPTRDRVPYSDSSSDDNASFDVEQFPCVDVRRQRFQRSNGRVRLRK